MRIGIDAHIIGKGAGGVERFVASLTALLPAAMPEVQFVGLAGKAAIASGELPQAPNLEWQPLASTNPLIERSLLLPWLCRRHQLDALIVQRLAPWICGRTRLITTVHDITPLKYPKAYRGLTNTLIRLLTGNTIGRSSLIFTPTQTVADELGERFSMPASHFFPFYNGVDLERFSPATQASSPKHEDYLFTSGAIEARKNLETLLRAKAKLGSRLPAQIWIAGGVRDARYLDSLQALCTSLGLEKQVRWLGFVSEEHLVELYRNARAFVTCSRDEGFNIPPLEAMACGTPVCCSDIAVHRELFTDAALFFDTESPASLAATLERLNTEPELRTMLATKALACVQRYQWPAMAARIAERLRARPATRTEKTT